MLLQQELAETMEMKYMETSAKEDINVTQMFESLARDILRAKHCYSPEKIIR